MIIDIITLFPDYFSSIFSTSILKRAISSNALKVHIHDLRQYCSDKHHKADDYRFGGGAGMLLKAEPFFKVFDEILANSPHRPLVIFPTPQGVPFVQKTADRLSHCPHMVFLCGHYKGIDQRVIDRFVDEEYSLGDFVLTGGEPAVAAMLDSCVRMIPGVLGNLDSALTDSFRKDGLDGAHYTRPSLVCGYVIPGVLKSGHHKNIDIWRRVTSLYLTRVRRPDLLSKIGTVKWNLGKK